MILPTIPGMGSVFDMIPAFLVLLYIPFLCYNDLKTRTIPMAWWIPIIALSVIPLYSFLQASTERNWYFFGISLLFCGVLFCMALLHIIGGADFIFASIIAIFVQTNPFHYPRVFFVIDFMIFLCVVSVFVPIVVWAYNTHKGNKYGVIDMFRKIDGHFPMMFVISAAFVISLIAEMI
jgi:Flp pilus assembly protein protease CpaA